MGSEVSTQQGSQQLMTSPGEPPQAHQHEHHEPQPSRILTGPQAHHKQKQHPQAPQSPNILNRMERFRI